MNVFLSWSGELGKAVVEALRDWFKCVRLESHRIVTTPTEHFVGVSIVADGERTPFFSGEFSLERLPDGAPLQWGAASKDLDPYFKPEFRDVLDGIHCPQVLSSL